MAILGAVLTFWASHPTMLAVSAVVCGVLGYLGYRSAR
jgi:uncharacterized membrane protein YoaK (UPF0700 family)